MPPNNTTHVIAVEGYNWDYLSRTGSIFSLYELQRQTTDLLLQNYFLVSNS